MRLADVQTPDGQMRYVLLDDDGSLVEPVVRYLKHLDQRGPFRVPVLPTAHVPTCSILSACGVDTTPALQCSSCRPVLSVLCSAGLACSLRGWRALCDSSGPAAWMVSCAVELLEEARAFYPGQHGPLCACYTVTLRRGLDRCVVGFTS